jgi:Sulfotransferase family
MPPDFVIVGAPRSGTTWLYSQLRRHAGLFLPVNKEPRFLAAPPAERFTGPGDDRWMESVVTAESDYEALFAGAGDRLTGEASTDYLYRGQVVSRRLHDRAPSARIIVLLRDPADRAHSAWKMLRQQGHESLDFGSALDVESRRIDDGWAWCWHYTEHGFYTRNLEPYFERFDTGQILILRYADIARRPQRVLDSVTDFLQIPALTGNDLTTKVNDRPLTRGIASSRVRQSILGTRIARVAPAALRRRARAAVDHMTLYEPSLDEATRTRLNRVYDEDLRRLPDLIGRRAGTDLREDLLDTNS